MTAGPAADHDVVGRRRQHMPPRPEAPPAHLPLGRTPPLRTVRQTHPALRPATRTPLADPDATAELALDQRPRRQELAPWSALDADGGGGAAAAETPADGTPAPVFVDDSGRRHRVGRRVAWAVVAGVGIYMVVIALGLAGVLFVGRLAPPGLDRLVEPAGNTGVVGGPDVDETPLPSTSEPTTDDAGSTSTVGDPAGSSSAAADSTPATASPLPTDAVTTGAETTASPPTEATTTTASPGRSSTTTTAPTTTTTEGRPGSGSPPSSTPGGGRPDDPPGQVP